MLDWMKSRRTRAVARPSEAAPSAREHTANAGEYQLLYKYLRDRYANRVVLTFAEIEDLLGFALPEAARFQREWWDGADPIAHPPAHSDSWRMANRTAIVNLLARTVVFDRENP